MTACSSALIVFTLLLKLKFVYNLQNKKRERESEKAAQS